MEPEAYTVLWQAHRSGEDPTAFSRIFDALHSRLLRALQARFTAMPSGDVEDAVCDAFVYLVMHPGRFDPKRASLPGFLQMIAVRRLTDNYRKARRQTPMSLDDPGNQAGIDRPTEGVASFDDDVINRVAFSGRDPHTDLRPEVQAWLEAVLPAPQDRTLLLMANEGRLTVEAFATLYGMESLPLDEQRRAMKRCRDRVHKRVQREGAYLWKLIYDEPVPMRFSSPEPGRGKSP